MADGHTNSSLYSSVHPLYISISRIRQQCLRYFYPYLEYIVRQNTLPSITREESEFLAPHQKENELQPSITRQMEFPLTSDTASERQSVALPTTSELEILRDRVLSQLKLGKQATGYKTAQKVLNRFVAELLGSV